MTLAHTILAMVGTKVARVRCNTCNGDHAYRGEPGKTSAPPKKSRATALPKGEAKVVIGWQERIDAKNPSTARKYSTRESFAADELLIHPTFGIGIVSAVRGDKIDVAFKGDQKTLMHGKAGGPPAEKPKFSPPNAVATGPADKPQADSSQRAPDEAEEPASTSSDAS